MAVGSGVTLKLEAKTLPLLPGALELARAGYLTGGCKRNRRYLEGKVWVNPEVEKDLEEVAFDPQTSGGLLIAVPEAEGQALLSELRKEGVDAATLIGRVEPRGEFWVELV
jgi:selenide,water dikinase